MLEPVIVIDPVLDHRDNQRLLNVLLASVIVSEDELVSVNLNVEVPALTVRPVPFPKSIAVPEVVQVMVLVPKLNVLVPVPLLKNCVQVKLKPFVVVLQLLLE